MDIPPAVLSSNPTFALVASIFIIDNYDSFTYNLVHLVEQLELPFAVKRNDAFGLEELEPYSHLLVSPGPGLPSEAGRTMEAIGVCVERKSILGVCLGMQALLEHFRARMVNMPTVEHGAQSSITASGDSVLFNGLRSPFKAGRYHSWAFGEEAVPSEFRITGRSEDRYVMAVEHRHLPLFGVQFHPESIMTEYGLEMMKNWVDSR